MADNEELDPPPPQDINNVFSAEDLSSLSSSDSAKYKHAWLKAKGTRSSILSSGGCPYACSRALSVAPNYEENFPLWLVIGAILPKKYGNAIIRHEQDKKNFPCNTSQ